MTDARFNARIAGIIALVLVIAIFAVTSCAIADNAGRARYSQDCVTTGKQLVHWNCVR